MPSDSPNPALLPAGLSDLLPPDAAREAAQELGLPRRDVYQLALGLADRD